MRNISFEIYKRVDKEGQLNTSVCETLYGINSGKNFVKFKLIIKFETTLDVKLTTAEIRPRFPFV